MRKHSKNVNEIVIPTFDTKSKKPCTVIFQVEKSAWKTIISDNRKVTLGGTVLSIANETRILYLGGFDSDGKKSKTIYELIDDSHWVLWTAQLMWPIGNDTIVQMNINSYSCQTPTLPLGKPIANKGNVTSQHTTTQ